MTAQLSQAMTAAIRYPVSMFGGPEELEAGLIGGPTISTLRALEVRCLIEPIPGRRGRYRLTDEGSKLHAKLNSSDCHKCGSLVHKMEAACRHCGALKPEVEELRRSVPDPESQPGVERVSFGGAIDAGRQHRIEKQIQ